MLLAHIAFLGCAAGVCLSFASLLDTPREPSLFKQRITRILSTNTPDKNPY